MGGGARLSYNCDFCDSYPLASSTWDSCEISAIERVIKGNFFTMGEKVAEFEKDFAKFVGSKYAVLLYLCDN